MLPTGPVQQLQDSHHYGLSSISTVPGRRGGIVQHAAIGLGHERTLNDCQPTELSTAQSKSLFGQELVQDSTTAETIKGSSFLLAAVLIILQIFRMQTGRDETSNKADTRQSTQQRLSIELRSESRISPAVPVRARTRHFASAQCAYAQCVALAVQQLMD